MQMAIIIITLARVYYNIIFMYRYNGIAVAAADRIYNIGGRIDDEGIFRVRINLLLPLQGIYI